MIKDADELAKLCRNLNLNVPCPCLKELCFLGRRADLSNRCEKCHRKGNSPLRFRSAIENGVPLIMRVCNSCILVKRNYRDQGHYITRPEQMV